MVLVLILLPMASTTLNFTFKIVINNNVNGKSRISNLCPEICWLFPSRVLEEESDVSLVHSLPSVGIHLQPPLGQLPLHWHRELVGVHRLA